MSSLFSLRERAAVVFLSSIFLTWCVFAEASVPAEASVSDAIDDVVAKDSTDIDLGKLMDKLNAAEELLQGTTNKESVATESDTVVSEMPSSIISGEGEKSDVIENNTTDVVEEESDAAKETREKTAAQLAALQYAFTSEIHDGMTFTARETGAGRSQMKVYRLGNLQTKNNPEKGLRALQKMLSKSIVLVRDAPESAQMISEEERNRTLAEFAKYRYRSRPANSSDTEDKNGTTETWRNLTVADVWTFDGWHLAKSLAEKHPSLFKMVDKPYENPEHVPDGYHILSASASIKRKETYKKVQEAMAESLRESQATNKNKKTVKKETLSQTERDRIPLTVAFSMGIFLLLGACFNFGRPVGKWKNKPTKKYIEKHNKSL